MAIQAYYFSGLTFEVLHFFYRFLSKLPDFLVKTVPVSVL